MLLRNIAVTCLPNDDSLKCAGIVYMRKRGGWFGRACSPAPAQGNGQGQIQSGYPWVGGAVSDCGDAVNPSLGAWPRHPCRGHPAIRHRPTIDSWPAASRSTPCVDEIRQISNSRLGSEPVAEQRDPTPGSDRSRRTVEGGVGPVEGV